MGTIKQENALLFDELKDEMSERKGPTSERLKRIDLYSQVKEQAMSCCRLDYGDVWEDPIMGHKVAVLDATNIEDVKKLFGEIKTKLIINDPPYNVAVGNSNTANLSKIPIKSYIDYSRKWIDNCMAIMDENSHIYIWIGLDYKDNFQPLPDFMLMMRDFIKLTPRNFITMRNQRGYGTQKNWMWVRQELLHYTCGKPEFQVVYTDIPKILRGYYKTVNGKRTENFERSKSNNIRPGNVWVDIQQVFYRMEENVPGCYAQKPLRAIERIILTSSKEGDLVVDFFAHSGTTLIAGEKSNRIVYTFDIDPIFAEITIRRLENYRKTGKTGWQWHSPFPEIDAKKD